MYHLDCIAEVLARLQKNSKCVSAGATTILLDECIPFGGVGPVTKSDSLHVHDASCPPLLLVDPLFESDPWSNKNLLVAPHIGDGSSHLDPWGSWSRSAVPALPTTSLSTFDIASESDFEDNVSQEPWIEEPFLLSELALWASLAVQAEFDASFHDLDATELSGVESSPDCMPVGGGSLTSSACLPDVDGVCFNRGVLDNDCFVSDSTSAGSEDTVCKHKAQLLRTVNKFLVAIEGGYIPKHCHGLLLPILQKGAYIYIYIYIHISNRMSL